jgi:hypothetical protein
MMPGLAFLTQHVDTAEIRNASIANNALSFVQCIPQTVWIMPSSSIPARRTQAKQRQGSGFGYYTDDAGIQHGGADPDFVKLRANTAVECNLVKKTGAKEFTVSP